MRRGKSQHRISEIRTTTEQPSVPVLVVLSSAACLRKMWTRQVSTVCGRAAHQGARPSP